MSTEADTCRRYVLPKLIAANYPDAAPFDLLCHVAYNAPLRTRHEGGKGPDRKGIGKKSRRRVRDAESLTGKIGRQYGAPRNA